MTPLSFYKSTIGKKVVMALTGLVWVGYLVAHMLGNLQVFLGPEKINEYSKFLHDSPGLLWSARLVLIGSIVLHVVASVQLTRANLAARPVGYRKRRDAATTYAARTMVWSGPLLLFFVVYHVLHLTLLVTPDYPLDPHHVYNNVVYGFQIPALAGFYLAAQGALGLHLYHGAWSVLQTVGLTHPSYDPARRAVATILTVVIVGGFASVPIAVQLGFLHPEVAAAAATEVPSWN